ncbi:MAG: hypothetical protein ACAI35_24820, partial [Candidatus Methylacidiphilales bacterium]
IPEDLPTMEGMNFTFTNDTDRYEGLDKAFDYRGDVTLTLASGETLSAFIFNREADLKPPRISVFVKGEDAPRYFTYSEINAVAFTGKDPANGKSWRNWVAKKHSERKAEADKLEAELKDKGYL